MIHLTHHHLWLGRSEVVLIYPESIRIYSNHGEISLEKPDIIAGSASIDWEGRGRPDFADVRGMSWRQRHKAMAGPWPESVESRD